MRASFFLFAALLCACLPACKDGPYSAPPGQFFCGTITCELGAQFCVLAPGADGGAEVATCAATTAACPGGTAACACVKSQCAGTCQQADDGSVTLSCPN